MDAPINVPIDNPTADTEWNDILRKHGVIPEKPPSPTPIIQEAIEEARKQVHENRLKDKDLDELDALEDEEDEAFLELYRKQRMAELATISNSSIFNQVYPLQKPDYPREVTEASNTAYVLVHLTSSLGTNIESRLLTELWRELARKYGDVKFCEMRADLCIEGYPEKNTPTILVYRDGEVKEQIITLKSFSAERTRITDLQDLLIRVGALKVDDPRARRAKPSDDGLVTDDNDNDEDDWD